MVLSLLNAFTYTLDHSSAFRHIWSLKCHKFWSFGNCYCASHADTLALPVRQVYTASITSVRFTCQHLPASRPSGSPSSITCQHLPATLQSGFTYLSTRCFQCSVQFVVSSRIWSWLLNCTEYITVNAKLLSWREVSDVTVNCISHPMNCI